jgi:hypothetical protein
MKIVKIIINMKKCKNCGCFVANTFFCSEKCLKEYIQTKEHINQKETEIKRKPILKEKPCGCGH